MEYEMTPAQSARLDQLSAQVDHFVQGARLAKVARDHDNMKVSNLIARIMSAELTQFSEDDLRGLVMTSTSALAEYLNDTLGPPVPDVDRSEIDDLAKTMDEDNPLHALVLAVDPDGNLVIPDDLPGPIADRIRDAIQFFNGTD